MTLVRVDVTRSGESRKCDDDGFHANAARGTDSAHEKTDGEITANKAFLNWARPEKAFNGENGPDWKISS